MKKRLLIFLFLILTLSSVFSKENTLDLLKNNDISFGIIEPNGKYLCSISCCYGKITCNRGTDYVYLESYKDEIVNENLVVYYGYSVFSVNGDPSFRNYGYPSYYKIIITKKQIQKRIESKKYKEIPNTSIKVEKSTSAMCICDNLRIREQPNTDSLTNIVGKLKKWEKIELIDCSEQKTKIGNLEYPWVKVRTNDGIEGWVFGGYVKIYFFDEDIEMLQKAFEKEGSEDTNQFIAPDNS